MSLTGLGSRQAATLDGLDPTRLFDGGASAHRRAIQFTNCDAGRVAFLRLAKAGESAPSISASDFDFAVGPRATLLLEISPYLEVWGINDSGSVATSSFSALEVLD